MPVQARITRKSIQTISTQDKLPVIVSPVPIQRCNTSLNKKITIDTAETPRIIDSDYWVVNDHDSFYGYYAMVII